MSEELKWMKSDWGVWILVACVFCAVLLVLVTVFDHEKGKATSPQALVAAAFSQSLTIQEWKPGLGPKPFLYHPAAANAPVWQPLLICPAHGSVGLPNHDSLGNAICPLCGQTMVYNSTP
jgi:hypothetical protein